MLSTTTLPHIPLLIFTLGLYSLSLNIFGQFCLLYLLSLSSQETSVWATKYSYWIITLIRAHDWTLANLHNYQCCSISEILNPKTPSCPQPATPSLFLVPHKSVIWPCHDLSLCIQSWGNLFASLLLSFLLYYCAFLWESATFPLQSSAQRLSNLPFSLFKMTKLCGRKSRNHTDNVPPQCCSADPSQFQCLSLASHLQFQPVTALLKSRNSF